MPGPIPPSFTPRFSAYQLVGIYTDNPPLPRVGTRVTVSENERLSALCAIRNVPFEDLEVHSHFEGDPVDAGYPKGYFVKLPRSTLSEAQLLRLWHRGLFQLPVGCTDSDDPMDAAPVPSPFETATQVQVRAFAAASDADLARVKKAFEGEGNELILCPWSEERSSWQPVDYANEAARLATADLRQSECALNPYAIILVGGAETRHEEDPAQDVVTVLVHWRQAPTTLDPQRTFHATVGHAKQIIAGIGGQLNPRLIQNAADELLDDDPAAIVRA